MNTEQASSIHRPAAPPTAQVISLGDLHGEPMQRAVAAPLLENTNPLHSVRARLQVCVGEVEMTVGELLSAKEHQVVALDRSVEAPVDLVLEGKVVARGHLVAVDGCFAIRISELPVPLKA